MNKIYHSTLIGFGFLILYLAKSEISANLPKVFTDLEFLVGIIFIFLTVSYMIKSRNIIENTDIDHLPFFYYIRFNGGKYDVVLATILWLFLSFLSAFSIPEKTLFYSIIGIMAINIYGLMCMALDIRREPDPTSLLLLKLKSEQKISPRR